MEWFLLALSFLFVSLRIKSYFMRGARRPIPEILLIVALVVETGCIICDTITYHLGGMAAEYIADVPDTLPLNKVFYFPSPSQHL